jgi:hypothetical protein
MYEVGRWVLGFDVEAAGQAVKTAVLVSGSAVCCRAALRRRDPVSTT